MYEAAENSPGRSFHRKRRVSQNVAFSKAQRFRISTTTDTTTHFQHRDRRHNSPGSTSSHDAHHCVHTTHTFPTSVEPPASRPDSCFDPCGRSRPYDHQSTYFLLHVRLAVCGRFGHHERHVHPRMAYAATRDPARLARRIMAKYGRNLGPGGYLARPLGIWGFGNQLCMKTANQSVPLTTPPRPLGVDSLSSKAQGMGVVSKGETRTPRFFGNATW